MVCLGTIGFALSVVVVLEFDSACWAACDAHCLCSCEYLFSELFVFSGACSAHRVFLFCVWVLLCCVRRWRVAASARRAPPPSNTTLFFSSFFLAFLCLWKGVCCVVRAQPCEHARNTTHVLCVLGLSTACGVLLLLPQRGVCCPHHTLFVVNDRHAHH